ncbi:MAG: glycosyltransferase family 2 protein [Planctomycetales bacterium]|nr:glycosyltransferase family 2 protein [Planctomycetales bacterium]
MESRFLTALPVFNEARHVASVLREVLRYSEDVLVVDDGSTDGTSELLRGRDDISVVRHEQNQGYGAALKTAFDYAVIRRYDVLVTIDCDGQHEPQRIPRFAAACERADIVSGSRYLQDFVGDNQAPSDRRQINEQVSREVNRRLGFELTDAFCGFKAYRTQAIAHLDLTEPGYAMPLELWVEAKRAGLCVMELPVPRIYLEEKRSFGGALDNAQWRLDYYHQVLDRAQAKAAWELSGADACASCVPDVSTC